LFFVLAATTIVLPARAEVLTLHTRSRTETAKGSGEWRATESTVEWDSGKTAIVICDMWNQHWCKGATARVAEMAPRMNEVIQAARRRGVLIIHCPSDTMKYYENTPQRKLAQAAPKVLPKVPLKGWVGLDTEREGKLPFDDSDGGCDDEPQCKTASPWTHEIDTLKIEDGDAITDSAEAYYLIEQRGIENVIVMGVHGNMCVLGRPFAIRQMVAQGKNVVVMRDMIDTMYNSRKAPYVNHFAGTDLLVEHIEKHWCPSITSVDFLGGEPFRFRADKRPRIVFVIGENEYHTWETLPEFARNELEWRGYNCSFVTAGTDVKDNVFTNFNVIKDADLLFVSARRRTPPKEMMALIRAHLDAGKPLVGIRTASHAFAAEPADSQHEGWPTFDVDVLGCNYQNHYNNSGPDAASTFVRIVPIANPILTGLPTDELDVQGSLYKSRNPGPNVTPLMTGKLVDGPEIEPVAWINTAHNRRVFYTSLGTPDNFKQPFFRELLLNGISWALNRPIPPVLAERPDSGPASQPAKPTAKAQSAPSTGAQKVQENPLTPAESLADFKIADDLEIDQVLTEPQARQPVFMNFDERGRLWVVEYLQYPNPAGLKMLSHDSVW
ncbi:MAG TPA: ThuA domain-containing protein, partial [Verrucomicrobiae bacterium]|nr:ThuA domain-containing protein [Verrucomicrobiae bacterium]